MVPFTSGIKLARESVNIGWSLGIIDGETYRETRPIIGSALYRAKSERILEGDGKGGGIRYTSKREEIRKAGDLMQS